MARAQKPTGRTKPISEAHRWARKRFLFGRRKPRVEAWQAQLAVEDTLALGEPERVQLVHLGDQAQEDSPSVDAVCFPDGSWVWWTEDLWGITDPDGVDANEQFSIVE